MIVKLQIMPNAWADKLPEAIKENENRCKILSIEKRPNEFSDVTLEVPDLCYVFMLGMWVGHLDLSEVVERSIPEVEENIKNLVKNITTQSEN
jgi:hypothetical protein